MSTHYLPVTANSLLSILDSRLIPLCASSSSSYFLPTIDITKPVDRKQFVQAQILLECAPIVEHSEPFISSETILSIFIKLPRGKLVSTSLLAAAGKIPSGIPTIIEQVLPHLALEATAKPSSLPNLLASINTKTLSSTCLLNLRQDLLGEAFSSVESSILEDYGNSARLLAQDLLLRALDLSRPSKDQWSTIANVSDHYINVDKERKLTYAEAQKVLFYDPESGYIRWKVSTNPTVHPGERAGFDHSSDQQLLKYGGEVYRSNRVAWLLHTKSWPEGRIIHIDNNPKNLKWFNLKQEAVE
jgi:hypothetical protein